MKRIFFKWISGKFWVYELAVKLIANRIVHGQNLLTPEYLIELGWVKDAEGYYIEPDIKDRDKIWIEFLCNCFRVWHGKERTFIGIESTVEWFEIYYILAHPDNGRHQLAGV